MATTWTFNGRPSAPTSACAPNVLAQAAQVHVLGHPAVQIPVRTAPVFGPTAGGSATTKINNYIGTAAAAMRVGATTSSLDNQALSAAREQKVQGDKVQGGDARGIPPRGKPV